MSWPVLVLATHGTRAAAGLSTTYDLAELVRSMRPQVDVRASFVDVASPSFAEVVAGVTGALVVVPALLSGGYHVRIDIPRVLGGRPLTVLAPALGPDRELSTILAERLTVARSESARASALLVSTGSSDGSARADVQAAAIDLSQLLGEPVRAAFMTGPGADLDAALAGPTPDVVSYLLAEGAFLDRLRRLSRAAGVRVVTEPIGAHPVLARLVLARYDRASRRLSADDQRGVQ